MTLKDYFLSLKKTEREIFAEKCGTTIGQIVQIYTGNRTCNASLAINFDRESNGAISCDELCPDVDFNYLRKQQAACASKDLEEQKLSKQRLDYVFGESE